MGADFSLILPEIVLSLFGIAGFLTGLYRGNNKTAGPLIWCTSAVMLAIAAWVGLQGAGTGRAFGGALVDDSFARFVKVTILVTAAVILAMSKAYLARRTLLRFEFAILIVFAVIGMMLTVSAGDLIVLFLGLGLQSLALWAVVALRRDSAKATEAALKLAVLGAFAAALLLYGASLIYGFSGTTRFNGIAAAVQADPSAGVLLGLCLVAAGVAFTAGVAPFHMWTPDVAEGAPTPVTIFFATAPKVAAAALLARCLHDALGELAAAWQDIVALIAVASMFLGGVAAIRQTNIKRMMAYATLAHMGFALLGLASGSAQGVEAMLIHLAVYVIMTLGVFAFILSMERDRVPVVEIRSLSQYSHKNPVRALALSVLLFSLAGAPPLIGFFAKYAVLLAAVNEGMYWLAVFGVLAIVLGAVHCLQIICLMYFGEVESDLETGSPKVLWSVLMASAAATVIGIVNLLGIEGAARAAAASLVN